MGMYTALEMCLKLKYRQDVACDVATAMHSCKDFDGCDDEIGTKPWHDHSLWLYRLSRMFRTDGGTAFGRLACGMRIVIEEVCDGKHVVWDKDLVVGTNHKYRLECEKSFIYLNARSSYKGTSHWDFIEWVKPDIVAGFVRWKFEGGDFGDFEGREDFGPLPGEPAILAGLEAEAAESRARSKDGNLNWWLEKYAEGIERAVSQMRQAK